ncbi:MAG TPA: AIR synthase related protein [Candidatus Dormibacteraeota bacterium]|nr:AIR synthase related protein [Candidatus Dormibacteraeota bacterium]
MSVQGIGELGLLERIKPYLAAGAATDDAAVIADATGFIVASCDTFVEGIHFDLGWMSAEDAGWRSLALALGDLAAKGAEPGWALAAVAIPRDWSINQLIGLYAGMAEIAQKYKLSIVGGDMSSIDGPAVLSLTVVGHTLTLPLSRALAEPGWSVAVTGPLGAAVVALRERRSLRLEPLIDEGRDLNKLALCCGDISDGLAREMEKFLAMSGVGCVLNAVDVPRAQGASIEDALASGEEAALVCVGPGDAIAKSGLHVVGKMTDDKRVVVAGATLERSGYDHFA